MFSVVNPTHILQCARAHDCTRSHLLSVNENLGCVCVEKVVGSSLKTESLGKNIPLTFSILHTGMGQAALLVAVLRYPTTLRWG